MNKVLLTGRITKDLEIKTTSTGKDVVNYSIAVPITKDLTEFIDITTFGENAKTLALYCGKGDLIGVEGQLRTNQYKDESGKLHKNQYVLSDRVDFLHTTKKEDNKEEPKAVEKLYLDDIEEDLPF